MKKLLSLFALPLFLGALPAANASSRYEVTPNYGYEGGYIVHLVNGERERGMLLDCPSGEVTFWDDGINKFVAGSVYRQQDFYNDMRNICLRRWGTPGSGLRS